MPSRPDIPKCTIACAYCRLKKAKCTGSNPCTNCVVHGEQCKFPNHVARPRKRTRHEALLEERLASLEQLIRRDGLRSSPPDRLVRASNDDNGGSFALQQMSPESLRPSLASETAPTPPATSRSVVVAPLTDNGASPANALSWTMSSSLNATTPVFEQFQDRAPANASLPVFDDNSILANPAETSSVSRRAVDDVASPAQRERGFVSVDQSVELGHQNPPRPAQPEQQDHSEHHGRASFLSICSPAGVEWVCRQLGNSNFHHSASRLALDVTRRLKMSKPLGIERTPDPDYQTALKWTTAFFDESLEHSLGLVPRHPFEARLEQHYREPRLPQNDLTWYALRNTVFAVGSRLVASPAGQPPNFTAAERLSWLYFENALSVHTNLVYMPSDVSLIEILVLMAYCCEGVSGPKLEYMLLVIAVGLSQSKGFHLRPPAQWRLIESEKATRRWLWWAIYIYDKHLASRSGRPSMIHDEDITITLPTEGRPDTRTDLNFMLNAIKHAQISSSIERDLFSARSKGKSLDELKNIVMRLDNELRSWHAGLEPEYRISTSNKPEPTPPRIRATHVLYLQNCFHGSLCILHTVMTQPWKNNRFQQSLNPVHAAQVQESSRIVAEAARSIILQSQQSEINATSPAWLVFYYPLLGAIHLFIHILRAPTSPSALSDVALMEVAAGAFARLEYASCGIVTITFVRELAEFARLLVSPPRNRPPSGPSHDRVPDTTHSLLEGANDMSFDEFTNFDITDFGCYEWPLLYSSPP